MEISVQNLLQVINTPGMALILYLIWRIDRRLLSLEIFLDIKKEKVE